MAKKYLVASEEGAGYTNEPEGSIVELELEQSDEIALVCAGWLEPVKKGGDK